MTGYDAVVFDNDGVLTHPTPAGVVPGAVRGTFEEFGHDPAEEAVERFVRGSTTAMRETAERFGFDLAAFWRRREERAAAAQRAEMVAGRKPLYDDAAALADLDVPLSVVSNNQQATVDAVVDVFGLDGVFAGAYGRDPTVEGYERKKPRTHYVDRALSDVAADPGRTLFVGDSNADLLVAERAGLDSAFVARPHREGYDRATEPTHVVDSLAALADLV
jgi:phosphoglycolate phosphatase-like HAD superfamily hydrolase